MPITKFLAAAVLLAIIVQHTQGQRKLTECEYNRCIIKFCFSELLIKCFFFSGVRVAAASSDGGPTGGRGPPTVLEFLVINFSVCLVLLSNCYIIIYCIV